MAHRIASDGRIDFAAPGGIEWTNGNVTYVPLSGDIQAYVTAATAGDTLILASGEYVITSTITVNKQLNIMGQGNAGFYTIPAAPAHGTVISSVTAAVTGFHITSSNVRVAHLSINLAGAGSTGIDTTNNLTGIVLTNVDVIVTCTGLAQGFMIWGSNAVLRNLTFYITSTNNSCSGLYIFNTNATTQNAVVDCFTVTGITKGTDGAGDNWSFICENNNDANTITLNLSNSICQALAGTAADIAVASISATTNNAIINCYLCELNGQDYDAYQDGTNVLNLGGSVLVNNLIFGTVTYRATMAAGSAHLGGSANYTEVEADGTLEFHGDATVWDDLRVVPGSFDRPGVSDPDIVAYAPAGGANTYLWEFAKNDIASFTVQLPHGYKEGTDIYAHIHWTPGTRGNEENGNTVGWKIDYTWANINGNFGAMATLDLSDTCDGTDHKHLMTPEVTIDGHTAAKTISSMIICNVKRTDTGADDTWASTTTGQLPLLLEIDFHYEMDTVGSRQQSAK